MALAGDDVDKMKEMQAAVKKGYEQAEKTWGGKLPSICSETLDAVNKLLMTTTSQNLQQQNNMHVATSMWPLLYTEDRDVTFNRMECVRSHT